MESTADAAEQASVTTSSGVNACENTVLGSLCCGDRQTTLGKEQKCLHVRYACTCLYLGRYYITQPHSFVGVEACTYCRECNPRKVGNICNARMSRNACIVSNVRNICNVFAVLISRHKHVL